MLVCQGFDIERVIISDRLYIFRITDLEGQVFYTKHSKSNIFLLEDKILPVLAAIVKKKTATSNPNINKKKKRSIYNTIFR